LLCSGFRQEMSTHLFSGRWFHKAPHFLMQFFLL
jgi:hypothetical protein